MRSAGEGSPSFVWVPGLARAGDEILIGGDEAHYLRRVVRVRAGECVTATDGEGAVAELVVLECGAEVRAEVRARRRVERGTRLELWCGAPEGDRADWLVEKLGELGVAVLRPLQAERASWGRVGQRADRWDRLATAALRQSRSAYRLAILPALDLPAALASRGTVDGAYLADPRGSALRAGPAQPGSLLAAVGPSSGFSEAEFKSMVDNGFVPTSLGGSRLRTETAALAMAVLALSWGGR